MNSSSEKYDVVLVGNLILETVITAPQWSSDDQTSFSVNSIPEPQLGGLGSLAQNLTGKIYLEAGIGTDGPGKQLKNKLISLPYPYCLHHHQESTSQAIIIDNLQSQTQLISWGGSELPFLPSFRRTRWTHLAYLDVLPIFDLTRFRECSDYLSAEVSLSDPSPAKINIVKSQLKYLDYFFISDENFLKYFKPEELGQVKNVIRYNKDKSIIYQNETLEVVNPLPGKFNISTYLSGFIEYQLHNLNNIEQAISAGYNKGK